MDRDYALIRQLPLRTAAEKKLHSEFWVNQMINDCRRLSTDSRISFDRALRVARSEDRACCVVVVASRVRYVQVQFQTIRKSAPSAYLPYLEGH